jgi:hypothetical protein
MSTPIPTIEIDEHGNCGTLYTEEIDLQDIGRLANVHRASWIRFDESRQVWTVLDATTGATVHENPSRSACIDWEIENFAPGGKHYHG